MILTNTNWSDPRSQITEHFTVHEATWLPTWGIYHTASTAERAELVRLCVILEEVRTLVGGQLNVHCMIRPNKVNCPNSSKYHCEDYNAAIGSTAKHSPHIYGQAADFSAGLRITCDEVRQLLLPELDRLGLRMEDGMGTNWVHVDTFQPSVSGGKRFFRV